ncbi:unnamed protein product [Effrenium voratum]|nr:unnamed protein product [Effrenium voratum]
MPLGEIDIRRLACASGDGSGAASGRICRSAGLTTLNSSRDRWMNALSLAEATMQTFLNPGKAAWAVFRDLSGEWGLGWPNLLERERHGENAHQREELLQVGHSTSCSLVRIPAVPVLVAMPLRNIQWLHFPKAGTSFMATIWNYACARRTPLDLGVSPRATPGCEQCYDMALMDRYPADEFCDDGYLSEGFHTQHTPVSLDLKQQNDWNIIGMFRRPSQRVISAFFDTLHATGMTEDEYTALMQACGPEGNNTASCYARYPGIAGCMSRMLTGETCAQSGVDSANFDSGKAKIPEALQMLQEMTFVGLTEYWDLSICLFHRMFGGNVSVSQLVDFHQGAVHDEDLYDESQLQGFVDEKQLAFRAQWPLRWHWTVAAATYLSLLAEEPRYMSRGR